jgi:hypothetical protein
MDSPKLRPPCPVLKSCTHSGALAQLYDESSLAATVTVNVRSNARRHASPSFYPLLQCCLASHWFSVTRWWGCSFARGCRGEQTHALRPHVLRRSPLAAPERSVSHNSGVRDRYDLRRDAPLLIRPSFEATRRSQTGHRLDAVKEWHPWPLGGASFGATGLAGSVFTSCRPVSSESQILLEARN